MLLHQVGSGRPSNCYSSTLPNSLKNVCEEKGLAPLAMTTCLEGMCPSYHHGRGAATQGWPVEVNRAGTSGQDATLASVLPNTHSSHHKDTGQSQHKAFISTYTNGRIIMENHH